MAMRFSGPIETARQAKTVLAAAVSPRAGQDPQRPDRPFAALRLICLVAYALSGARHTEAHGPTSLLTLQNIQLTFGGTQLLEAAELIVSPGDRIALVGRNGSGKSTLLRIAAGRCSTMPASALPSRAPPSATAPGARPQRIRHDSGLCRGRAGPGDDPYRAQYLLQALGLTARRTRARSRAARGRRAALARVLAPQPDVLLLDEPTNHLDLPVIEWLQDGAHPDALSNGADQPRPAVPVRPLPRHRLAGPGRDAAPRARLCRLRGLARRRAGAWRRRSATSSTDRSCAKSTGCATG